MKAVFGLFLLITPLAAIAQEHTGHLPIDVPRGGHVNFEVDAPASELVPMISQMFGTPGAPAGTISIKTAIGTFSVDGKDLADLLRPIKELHVVSFDDDPAGDSLAHYEREFTQQGMKRMAVVGGSDAVLMFREPGQKGRYAAMLEQDKRVTVVRTDGMPDLGILGRMAIEKLAEAAQKVKRRVLH